MTSIHEVTRTSIWATVAAVDQKPRSCPFPLILRSLFIMNAVSVKTGKPLGDTCAVCERTIFIGLENERKDGSDRQEGQERG
jgi:hypothetical protein